MIASPSLITSFQSPAACWAKKMDPISSPCLGVGVVYGWECISQENKNHSKYFKNLIQGIGYTGDGVTQKPHRQCSSETSQSRKLSSLPIPTPGAAGAIERDGGPWRQRLSRARGCSCCQRLSKAPRERAKYPGLSPLPRSSGLLLAEPARRQLTA